MILKIILQRWFNENSASIIVEGEDKTNDFIHYMNDFPYIVLEKDDFQKGSELRITFQIIIDALR